MDRHFGAIVMKAIATLVFLIAGFYIGMIVLILSTFTGTPEWVNVVIAVICVDVMFILISLVWNSRLMRRMKYIPLYIIGAGLLAVGVNTAIEAYDASIPTVREYRNLYEYQPFEPESRIVRLSGTSSLTVEDNLPRLDCATALYPVLAAFVEATYPEDEYDYYFGIVRSSGTTEAYLRLSKGETDIILVAEPSKSQLEMFAAAGLELKFTPLGREAFVFFVNSKNPVDNLTVEQIQGIYGGKITNWRDIGGRNESIRAFQRPNDSGSQTALQKLMGDAALMPPETEEVASGMGDIISQTADYKNYGNAIGYSFRFYSTEMVRDNRIKLLRLNGVYPDKQTIRSGEYPLAAEFYAVTVKNRESLNVERLIAWMLSDQGQYIVEETGYVAVNENAAQYVPILPPLPPTPPSQPATQTPPPTSTLSASTWIEGYTKVLTELFPSGVSSRGIDVNNVHLYDLDLDGTPEMLIDYIYANSLPAVYYGYTFKNGTVTALTPADDDGTVTPDFSLWRNRATGELVWIHAGHFNQNKTYSFSFSELSCDGSSISLGRSLLKYTVITPDSPENTAGETQYRLRNDGGEEDVTLSRLNAGCEAAFAGLEELTATNVSCELYGGDFSEYYCRDGKWDTGELNDFFGQWGGMPSYIDAEALLEENAQKIMSAIVDWPDFKPLALGLFCRVIGAAAGDLNGDGFDDLAVVTECSERGQQRETFVLMREGEGYTVDFRSRGLVRARNEGGVYGDPFERITIIEGVLTVSNYGGSAFRWRDSFSFSCSSGGLRLVSTQHLSLSIHTTGGTNTVFDCLSGVCETRSVFGGDEVYNDLLLYSYTFEHDDIYFGSRIWPSRYQSETGTPYAPDLGKFEYSGYYNFTESELPLTPKISATQALDLVMEKYYPDSQKIEISWTDETKRNYEKLLYYAMPDYYYECEKGVLYYYSASPSKESDGAAVRVSHMIFFRPHDSNSVYYRVDGETGIIDS